VTPKDNFFFIFLWVNDAIVVNQVERDAGKESLLSTVLCSWASHIPIGELGSIIG
jgi:hypothetical protein